MDGWTGGVGNERVIYIGIIIWPLSEIHEEITRRPRDQEYASSFFFYTTHTTNSQNAPPYSVYFEGRLERR